MVPSFLRRQWISVVLDCRPTPQLCNWITKSYDITARLLLNIANAYTFVPLAIWYHVHRWTKLYIIEPRLNVRYQRFSRTHRANTWHQTENMTTAYLISIKAFVGGLRTRAVTRTCSGTCLNKHLHLKVKVSFKSCPKSWSIFKWWRATLIGYRVSQHSKFSKIELSNNKWTSKL